MPVLEAQPPISNAARIATRRICFYRLRIAMAAANIMTEAAIITRSGFTEDFADFAIAPPPNVLGRQISFPSRTADKAQRSPPIA
jgi:hypothetical protein